MAITARPHACIHNQPTLDPDIRRCQYIGCDSLFRVPRKPAPAQEHSPASKSAARAIESPRARLRARVYEVIQRHPEGLTDEKGVEITGMDQNTYRPRRVELVESGAVIDSGKKRLTKSGREATVWVSRS